MGDIVECQKVQYIRGIYMNDKYTKNYNVRDQCLSMLLFAKGHENKHLQYCNLSANRDHCMDH